jgi:Bacteriophage HK97-gp10, putative tail-component
MPSRNLYSFDIGGIDTMILTLEQIEKELFKKIDKTLTKLAEKVIEDAKKLAPLDSGDLEAALVVGDVKQILQRVYVDFGTSPEVDHYSVVQHEGFRETKDGKIIFMKEPGPKTASKPSHKGYTPGKKYLENAIKINEKLIAKELAAALKF